MLNALGKTPTSTYSTRLCRPRHRFPSIVSSFCFRPFFCAISAILLSTATASGGIVVNPRLSTGTSIDTSTPETVVRQIITPKMTDEQKVLACWRFMLDHFYHWHPPQEKDVPTDVRDFAKAINSYGYGPCFVNAPILTALWESAGFKSRSWDLSGHTVSEVYYGDTWHMLDADARAWSRKTNGQIASVMDLAADPSLFLTHKEKSDPYYPFAQPDVVAAPLKPWSLPSRLMDLYQSVDNNSILNNLVVSGHPMYLALRPGEQITLNATNEGVWNQSGPWYFPKRIQKEDDTAIQTGPVDITGTSRYGNGKLTWKAILTNSKATKNLWLGTENVKSGKLGLEQDNRTRQGLAVLRVWCPYVMVGGQITSHSNGSTKTPLTFEISTDGGYEWTPLPATGCRQGQAPESRKCNWDVGNQVTGSYEYLFRAHLEQTSLAEIDFTTTFQVAPLSLPSLKPGKNTVTIFRGPDEGHVQLILGRDRVASERYLVAKAGTLATGQLAPQNTGEQCSVVYQLTAPRALTSISVGGHLNMVSASGQYVETSYSPDEGKTWLPIWRQNSNTSTQDIEYERDKRVLLDNRHPKTRKVLVKFTMLRNSPSCSVEGIRLYGFYRLAQEQNAKLKAELVWQEKSGPQWQEKKLPVVVSHFPHSVDILCAGESIKLLKITMTPSR